MDGAGAEIDLLPVDSPRVEEIYGVGEGLFVSPLPCQDRNEYVVGNSSHIMYGSILKAEKEEHIRLGANCYNEVHGMEATESKNCKIINSHPVTSSFGCLKQEDNKALDVPILEPNFLPSTKGMNASIMPLVLKSDAEELFSKDPNCSVSSKAAQTEWNSQKQNKFYETELAKLGIEHVDINGLFQYNTTLNELTNSESPNPSSETKFSTAVDIECEDFQITGGIEDSTESPCPNVPPEILQFVTSTPKCTFLKPITLEHLQDKILQSQKGRQFNEFTETHILPSTDPLAVPSCEPMEEEFVHCPQKMSLSNSHRVLPVVKPLAQTSSVENNLESSVQSFPPKNLKHSTLDTKLVKKVTTKIGAKVSKFSRKKVGNTSRTYHPLLPSKELDMITGFSKVIMQSPSKKLKATVSSKHTGFAQATTISEQGSEPSHNDQSQLISKTMEVHQLEKNTAPLLAPIVKYSSPKKSGTPKKSLTNSVLGTELNSKEMTKVDAKVLNLERNSEGSVGWLQPLLPTVSLDKLDCFSKVQPTEKSNSALVPSFIDFAQVSPVPVQEQKPDPSQHEPFQLIISSKQQKSLVQSVYKLRTQVDQLLSSSRYVREKAHQKACESIRNMLRVIKPPVVASIDLTTKSTKETKKTSNIGQQSSTSYKKNEFAGKNTVQQDEQFLVSNKKSDMTIKNKKRSPCVKSCKLGSKKKVPSIIGPGSSVTPQGQSLSSSSNVKTVSQPFKQCDSLIADNRMSVAVISSSGLCPVCQTMGTIHEWRCSSCREFWEMLVKRYRSKLPLPNQCNHETIVRPSSCECCRRTKYEEHYRKNHVGKPLPIPSVIDEDVIEEEKNDVSPANSSDDYSQRHIFQSAINSTIQTFCANSKTAKTSGSFTKNNKRTEARSPRGKHLSSEFVDKNKLH